MVGEDEDDGANASVFTATAAANTDKHTEEDMMEEELTVFLVEQGRKRKMADEERDQKTKAAAAKNNAEADEMDKVFVAAKMRIWKRKKSHEFAPPSEAMVEALYQLTAAVTDRKQLVNAYDLALMKHPIMEMGM